MCTHCVGSLRFLECVEHCTHIPEAVDDHSCTAFYIYTPDIRLSQSTHKQENHNEIFLATTVRTCETVSTIAFSVSYRSFA